MRVRIEIKEKVLKKEVLIVQVIKSSKDKYRKMTKTLIMIRNLKEENRKKRNSEGSTYWTKSPG